MEADKSRPSSEQEDSAAEKIKRPKQKPNLKQVPPKKIPRPYLAYLKKIGFTIWLSVMIIGGILAFLTSLLLL